MYVGDVPEELRDLTVVEEVMISCCHAKLWIIQLNEEGGDASSTAQQGLWGHVIVFPQHPEQVLGLLPPMLEVSMPICVILISLHLPSFE